MNYRLFIAYITLSFKFSFEIWLRLKINIIARCDWLKQGTVIYILISI